MVRQGRMRGGPEEGEMAFVITGIGIKVDTGIEGVLRGSLAGGCVRVSNLCCWFRLEEAMTLKDEPFFYGTQRDIAECCNGRIPSRIRFAEDGYKDGVVMDKAMDGMVSYLGENGQVYSPVRFYTLPVDTVCISSRMECVDVLLKSMRNAGDLFRNARKVKANTKVVTHYPVSFCERARETGCVLVPRKEMTGYAAWQYAGQQEFLQPESVERLR